MTVDYIAFYPEASCVLTIIATRHLCERMTMVIRITMTHSRAHAHFLETAVEARGEDLRVEAYRP